MADAKQLSEISESHVEVDMEAPVSEEDVLKAGGFGARDALGTPLPEAMDATDFEEAVMSADEQGGEKHNHFGVGYDVQQVEDEEEEDADAEEEQEVAEMPEKQLNDIFVPASGQTQGIATLRSFGSETVPRFDACHA